MIGRFALLNVGTEQLLGVVAQSRGIQLRDRYLAVADAAQPDGQPADEFFDQVLVPSEAIGNTVTYFVGGVLRSFVLLRETLVLGREAVTLSATGQQAPVTLQGALVHELMHAMDLQGNLVLAGTPDSDGTAYTDTALAALRSQTSGFATVGVLRSFVREIIARHVHWILHQELAGTPGSLALLALPPASLVAGALFYFMETTNLFDPAGRNGYLREIHQRGSAAVFAQLGLWLGVCARFPFSTDPVRQQAATAIFLAAAQECRLRQGDLALPLPEASGLFPLRRDFV